MFFNEEGELSEAATELVEKNFPNCPGALFTFGWKIEVFVHNLTSYRF